MKKIVITCLSIAVLGMVSCKDEKKDTEDSSSEMNEDTTEMVKELSLIHI